MEESSTFPPIDPTTFDLIIAGTGLAESIIAAAASAAGKTVLHLDANSFYGSHFSTLSLPEIAAFLENSQLHSAPTTCASNKTASSDYNTVEFSTRSLISSVEVSAITPELEHCGRFSLDVSGPRVLFCADSAVNVMIKTGISEYLEFKSVDGSYIYEQNVEGDGGLTRVPFPHEFKDKSIPQFEKPKLNKLFRDVQKHLESATKFSCGEGGDETEPAISPQDLDSPFLEFLVKRRLSPKIISIILYVIVMANYHQDKNEDQHLLKTEDAISRVALYLSSTLKIPDAASGMLYPMYGLGEVPQAFCRCAAVKGCIYVLRMPVVGLLTDKDTGLYKGVKLDSGQELFSEKLIVDPSIAIPQSLSSNKLDDDHEHSEQHRVRKSKVARGICIIKRSIAADKMNVRVIHPPRSLCPEQETAIRALQIGSSLAVCPSNMFVLYLSTPCEDALQGKKLLNAAIKSLCTLPDEERRENCSTSQDSSSLIQDGGEDGKPTLLWRALYVQEVVESSNLSGSIVSAPSPDGELSYNNHVDAALKLFRQIYPEAELFPQPTSPADSENDVALESILPEISEDDIVLSGESSSVSSAQ